MTLALMMLLGFVGLLAGLVGARRWEARTWARSLVAYRLSLPHEVSTKDVASWLGLVGAQTVPPRFSLLPAWPTALEVEATSKGITHTVLVPRGREVALLASLKAALPGVRVEETELPHAASFSVAAELAVTAHNRPLGDDRAATAANGLLAALHPLPRGAVARVQVLLAGTRASGKAPDGERLDREAERKQRAPLMVASVRLAAVGPTRGHASGVLHRLVSALRVLEAPGVYIVKRWLPSGTVARRIVDRRLPLFAWPLTLNALEAAGVAGFPLDGVRLPGLPSASSRLLPPANDAPSKGVVLGEASYPGANRQLVVPTRDRLMHSWVLGPSGVGKSTLLTSMALQDIAAGRGVVVIDPKNDLVDDILARFPDERRGDLILLNASNTTNQLGFNPLQPRGNVHARELAAETTSHIIKSIFSESWGPRTDDVLRAALNTLTTVPAPNGEPFTLVEVPELLTSPQLRQYVMRSSRLPERWRRYWQEFDARSEANQLNIVGPSLNKLRSFTHRTSLRLILGQSRGFDISEVFTRRNVVLVQLCKGQIGSEAATLLGSLFMGALWQATLARSSVPADRRHSVFAYLDEFQETVRLSDELADVAAQARSLGLGLILANQYAKQLPESVRNALLGTVRTHAYFQLDHDDARLLHKRTAPLTADDLMGLGAYEIAARLCVGGSTRAPVTGRTLPLMPARHDLAVLKRGLASTQTPVPEIEAALQARTHVHTSLPTRLGQVLRRKGDS